MIPRPPYCLIVRRHFNTTIILPLHKSMVLCPVSTTTHCSVRESNLIGVQLCHATSPPTLTALVYHTPHERMPITLSIPCINCQDAATECIPSSHTKSSCARCSMNNLQCVFTSWTRMAALHLPMSPLQALGGAACSPHSPYPCFRRQKGTHQKNERWAGPQP